MYITICSLFPNLFPSLFQISILGRAQAKSLIRFSYINIRDFATDKHKSVDDRPYGGGVGMLLRVDVVEKAIAYARKSVVPKKYQSKTKVILLDPKGKLFSQSIARKLSKLSHLILVCGHYEGFDQRISNYVDETISIGRYVLCGGEIPAVVIAETVIRLVPGVVGKEISLADETFKSPFYHEYPQFTRPQVYKGLKVPKVLLSGNHALITHFKKVHTKNKEKIKLKPYSNKFLFPAVTSRSSKSTS